MKSDIYLSACHGEDNCSTSGSGSGRERRQSDESVTSVGDEESAEYPRLTHSPPQGATAFDPEELIGESIESCSRGLQSSNLSLSKLESVQQILLSNQLQTVHEDKELSTATSSASQASHSKSKKHFGLTKESLLATEFHRATEFQKGRKGETGPRYSSF